MVNEEVVSLFLAIAPSTFTREQVEQQLRTKVKPQELKAVLLFTKKLLRTFEKKTFVGRNCGAQAS